MQLSNPQLNESLEEILLEVTENNNIHIKNVGGILKDNGVNNIKNITEITSILREKGITVLKG